MKIGKCGPIDFYKLIHKINPTLGIFQFNLLNWKICITNSKIPFFENWDEAQIEC
jgi:hypothetical protein